MDDIQGTCMTMCPRDEVRMRERNRLLHPFEIIPETKKHKLPKADRTKIVKEYTRPAAGKTEPTMSDLRPAPVLLKTVRFLVEKVLPISTVPWCRVYEYVFDRLRAVRQDMVIQRIKGPEAVSILETAVRFHIYSAYALCEEKMADFDVHINDTHTQECLKRLLVLYADGNESNTSNAAEFISLYLVYNLGNSEALRFGLLWKPKLYSIEVFKNSLDMSLAAWLNNITKVFKLASTLPAIHLCAFHRHIASLQQKSLKMMSHAYNSKALKFNTDHLVRLLWFSEVTECMTVCEMFGLSVADGGIIFNKTNFKPNITLPQKYCHRIDRVLKKYSVPTLLHNIWHCVTENSCKITN